MGRPLRAAEGGFIYHVWNRANARQTIFEHDRDYEAFEAILAEAAQRFPTEIFAWCLMPNHWHFVVRPKEDGELSQFFGWLTLTHTQRWHAFHQSVGTGHIYQGRFKSFPVQDDAHFLTVCRYVERNPLRARLVATADDWQWGSLWRWARGPAKSKDLLSTWPIRRSPDWLDYVNAPQTDAELAAIRRSIQRGSPLGEATWSQRAVRRLGLESTLRPRGRPKKAGKGS